MGFVYRYTGGAGWQALGTPRHRGHRTAARAAVPITAVPMTAAPMTAVPITAGPTASDDRWADGCRACAYGPTPVVHIRWAAGRAEPSW